MNLLSLVSPYSINISAIKVQVTVTSRSSSLAAKFIDRSQDLQLQTPFSCLLQLSPRPVAL